jgi:hypothetical protein
MSDTVFNDPDKRRRTLQNTANYFKTDDRPLGDRLSGLIGGLFKGAADQDRKKKLAESLSNRAQAEEE